MIREIETPQLIPAPKPLTPEDMAALYKAARSLEEMRVEDHNLLVEAYGLTNFQRTKKRFEELENALGRLNDAFDEVDKLLSSEAGPPPVRRDGYSKWVVEDVPSASSVTVTSTSMPEVKPGDELIISALADRPPRYQAPSPDQPMPEGVKALIEQREDRPRYAKEAGTAFAQQIAADNREKALAYATVDGITKKLWNKSRGQVIDLETVLEVFKSDPVAKKMAKFNGAKKTSTLTKKLEAFLDEHAQDFDTLGYIVTRHQHIPDEPAPVNGKRVRQKAVFTGLVVQRAFDF